MDGVTVKVEEDYEQKPIPLPVGQVSSSGHEVFEIKVELEDDYIKEEQPLLPVAAVSGNDSDRGDVKEEKQEPHVTAVTENNKQDVKEENCVPIITSVSGNGDEQDIKEENGLPIITSVSGNNDGSQQDVKEETSEPNVPLETRTEQTGEKRKADEDLGPASKSLDPSDAAVAKEDEDSYDCEFCGEKFARRPRLGKHIMAKHLDELLVKCPECDMQFANKRALASHQMFHTGKKIFLCKSCGAAFKYVSNYVSHVNDHMGVQPYECGECGRGFSTKRRVNLHVDTCHSPFWPYKCSLCLAPFLEERKFLRHQEKKHGIVRERRFRRSYMDTY